MAGSIFPSQNRKKQMGSIVLICLYYFSLICSGFDRFFLIFLLTSEHF